MSWVPLLGLVSGPMVGKACRFASKPISAAIIPAVTLQSACQSALPGSSTATFGVSATIVAGCAAPTGACQTRSLAAGESSGVGPNPIADQLDRVVPYRLEFHPVVVCIGPESAASGVEHRDLRATNILVY